MPCSQDQAKQTYGREMKVVVDMLGHVGRSLAFLRTGPSALVIASSGHFSGNSQDAVLQVPFRGQGRFPHGKSATFCWQKYIRCPQTTQNLVHTSKEKAVPMSSLPH